MNIKMTFEKPEQHMLELLDADLNYFKHKLKSGIITELLNMKDNRQFKFKIIQILKSMNSYAELNFEVLETYLEVVKTLELSAYDITDYTIDNTVVVDIRISDEYFDLNSKLTNTFTKAMGYTKKSVIRKFEKVLRNDYKIKTYKFHVNGKLHDNFVNGKSTMK